MPGSASHNSFHTTAPHQKVKLHYFWGRVTYWGIQNSRLIWTWGEEEEQTQDERWEEEWVAKPHQFGHLNMLNKAGGRPPNMLFQNLSQGLGVGAFMQD